MLEKFYESAILIEKKITNSTDTMFPKFKELANKHGAADAEINFQQELANQSSAEARQAGGKAPAKAEAEAMPVVLSAPLKMFNNGVL